MKEASTIGLKVLAFLLVVGAADAQAELRLHQIDVLIANRSGTPIEGAKAEFIASDDQAAEVDLLKRDWVKAAKPMGPERFQVSDQDGRMTLRCFGTLHPPGDDKPPSELRVKGQIRIIVPGFRPKNVPIDKRYPLRGRSRLTIKLGQPDPGKIGPFADSSRL